MRSEIQRRAGATGGPARRGRPPAIDEEQLLDVARELFLEKGVRATTAEVAERAAISQGTIFHRFGTKEALFRRALRYDPSSEAAALTNLTLRAGEGSLAELLVEVGLDLLERGSVALPLMMMEWSNPTGRASLDRITSGNDKRITHALDALRAFFESERSQGRIAGGVNPEILARVFAGSLHHFCLQETLAAHRASRATRRRYVRGVVDLLLSGIGATTQLNVKTSNERKEGARRAVRCDV